MGLTQKPRCVQWDCKYHPIFPECFGVAPVRGCVHCAHNSHGLPPRRDNYILASKPKCNQWDCVRRPCFPRCSGLPPERGCEHCRFNSMAVEPIRRNYVSINDDSEPGA